MLGVVIWVVSGIAALWLLGMVIAAFGVEWGVYIILGVVFLTGVTAFIDAVLDLRDRNR